MYISSLNEEMWALLLPIAFSYLSLWYTEEITQWDSLEGATHGQAEVEGS
jgi:hypothetical protein